MYSLILRPLILLSILQLIIASVYQPVLGDPARTYLWDIYLSDTPGLEVLAQNWHIDNEIGASRMWTTCDDGYLPFLGGIDLTTPVSSWERTYAGINSHNIIYYNILLYVLGSWEPHNYLSIQFGDSPPKIWRFDSLINDYGLTDFCYEGRLDYRTRIYGKALHTGDVLTIKMSYNLSSTAGPNVGFGFRDLTLIFRNNTGSETNEHLIELVNTTYIAEASQCYIYEYWDSANSDCGSCVGSCMNCFGSSSNDCDKCPWGNIPINNFCTACHSTCGMCTGPNANQCVACWSSSLVLDYDNTCKASCSPGYVERGSGEARKCMTPCNPGQFMIWNGSCVDSCSSPLVQSTADGVDLCDSPCNQAAHEYYNWNRTCVVTCEASNIRTEPYGYLFCDICPQDQVKYESIDGECMLISDCNYPDIMLDYDQDSSIKICTPNITSNITQNITTNITQNITPSSITPEEIQQMDKIQQFLQTSGFFAVIIGIIKSVLHLNGGQLILIVNVSKMLRYSRYLFINYPPKVKYMLELNYSDFGVFNFPGFIFGSHTSDNIRNKFPDYPLPLASNDPNLHSSFFVNYLDKMVILFLFICVIGLISLGKISTPKSSKIKKFFEKALILFKWNYFFLIVVTEYGDMVLFTCLQMVTMHFDSAPTIISFAACIVANILGAYILLKMFTINLSQRKILKKLRKGGRFDVEQEEELSKRWENYKICFVEYKNHTFAQQIFLLVTLLRMAIFNLTIGLLYDYPLTQVGIFLLLSVAMCTYLATQRAIKENLVFIENLISEAFILVYNMCLVYLAILDNKNQEQETTREKIGELMIAINIILKALFTVFGVIGIYTWLKQIYVHYILSRNRKKITPIRIPEGVVSPKEALNQKAGRIPYSVKSTLTDIDMGSSRHEDGNSSKAQFFNNRSRTFFSSQHESPVKDPSKILASTSSIDTLAFSTNNLLMRSRKRQFSRRTHSQFKEDVSTRELSVGSKIDLIEDHGRSDISKKIRATKFFF